MTTHHMTYSVTWLTHSHDVHDHLMCSVVVCFVLGTGTFVESEITVHSHPSFVCWCQGFTPTLYMICFQHSTILSCYVNAIVDQWCLAQRCLRTRVCWITGCSIWMRLWAIVVRTSTLLPLCLRLKGEPASLYGHNCGCVFGLSDQLGHTLGKTVLVVQGQQCHFPLVRCSRYYADIMLVFEHHILGG